MFVIDEPNQLATIITTPLEKNRELDLRERELSAREREVAAREREAIGREAKLKRSPRPNITASGSSGRDSP
jgi:hypothetical protein